MTNVALVVGGSGIVGRAFLEEYHEHPDWRCIGVSRRVPRMETRAKLLSIDVLDADAVQANREHFREVSHIFFTAYLKRRSNTEEVQVNLDALKNVVGCVEAVSDRLQHVQLMQGSKWYGCHLGPYRTPARESDPPHPMPIFYHAQQAWLEQQQKGKNWTWSSLRPHGIWGIAIGSELNHINTIAVYAAIMKQLGQPLHFPGKRGAFEAVYQCTDATHLAKAMVWAGTEPAAANEAFNMTNGDFIRWNLAWPVVAKWFGMEPGQPVSLDLAAFIAENEGTWRDVCDRYGLKVRDIRDLTTLDNSIRSLFNADWDQMSSIAKAQKAGWSGICDTYDMIPRQFDRLAAEGILPRYDLGRS